jgi:trigger factor
LKIEVTDLNPCKKEISIEVEAEDLKEDLSTVCSRYQLQGRVPGFRPGKAPMHIIKQRYKDAIREDFLDRAVQRYFVEALKTEKLSPLHSPHVHDLHFEEGKPLQFKAEFEVLPVFEIDNYKGLEVEKMDVSVSDEEVENALKRMQEQLAEYVPVEDRLVQAGDFAVVSYTSKYLDGSGTGPEAKEVYCEVGGGKTPPEFNESLPGMKVGESKTIAVKYPADFPNKMLAGKELEYAVELNRLIEMEMEGSVG